MVPSSTATRRLIISALLLVVASVYLFGRRSYTPDENAGLSPEPAEA